MLKLTLSEYVEPETVFAGTLTQPRPRRAVRGELPANTATARDLHQLRLALLDDRDAQERALDAVVDRLLEELSE